MEADITKINSFRSTEEAYTFIKNYETASNHKFVKLCSNHMNLSDLTTLENRHFFFDVVFTQAQQSEVINDGIPYITLGVENRGCQYGRQYKLNRKQKADNGAQELETPKKRRMVNASKKIDCPAKIRMKKILKFPDYLIGAEERNSDNQKRARFSKLREYYSEETKRYVEVLVQIDTCHNHSAMPVRHRVRGKTGHRKTDKGCNRMPQEQMPACERGPVLKRFANLRGKDLSDLALQFKAASELPTVLARPKTDKRLEEMDTHQLMGLYHEITGQVPNDMFATAKKQLTSENLLLLLHLCIKFANAAGNEQTHPSIRIKGSENDFTPVECFDAHCALTDSHMHCPLCPRTDSYTDPTLLRAHFTKQHVNKALEFSGLKILRCYDLCDVESSHQDFKTVKGGHWHCYKCSNASEERLNILSHFKVHLKEFDSSFQVHVSQSVNPSMSFGTISHEIENAVADIPIETSGPGSTSQRFSPLKSTYDRSPTKRQYADTGLGDHVTTDQNVLYVEEDEMGNVLSTYTAQEIPTSGAENVVVTYADSLDVSQLKSKIRGLEIHCKQLEKENILHKSMIKFLEDKNAALSDKHLLEKEELIAEIAQLKGRTDFDDTPEFDTNDEDTVADEIIETAQRQSTGAVQASLYKQKDNEIEKERKIKRKTFGKQEQNKTKIQEGQRSSEGHSLEIVCDQLSGIKKEIEGLKSTLYGNSVNMNKGTNPAGQGTAPFCTVSGQGFVSPYPLVMFQNLTGFNTSPQKTLQNTTAHNLSSQNTHLNIPNTFPLNTVTCGANKEVVKTSALNANKSGTVSVVPAPNQQYVSSSISPLKAPGLVKTAQVNTRQNSIVTNLLSANTQQNALNINSAQYMATPVTGTNKTETKTHLKKTLISDCTSGTVVNTPFNMNSGGKNMIPYLVIKNQNGAACLIPKNSITGLGDGRICGPGFNSQTAKTATINSAQKRSDTDSVKSETSYRGKAYAEGAPHSNVKTVYIESKKHSLNTNVPGKSSVNVEIPSKDSVRELKSDLDSVVKHLCDKGSLNTNVPGKASVNIKMLNKDSESEGKSDLNSVVRDSCDKEFRKGKKLDTGLVTKEKSLKPSVKIFKVTSRAGKSTIIFKE